MTGTPFLYFFLMIIISQKRDFRLDYLSIKKDYLSKKIRFMICFPEKDK